MKVFYCCYGSAHTSVVAASIHLGLLPKDKIPVSKEFTILPHYDETESFEIGTPFFMGKDEFEADVYIIGMINQRDLIKNTIRSYLRHCGINDKDILMVDTLKGIGIMTKIGGFASRRLGLIKIGRPLTIWGIQQRYIGFVNLVNNVKAKQRNILYSNRA